MKKIDNQSWGNFKFGDLLSEIYKAKAYSIVNLTTCNKHTINSIKHISRTDVNNGCDSYVLKEDFFRIEKGNAITIGDTTSTIFYQKEEFICGDHLVIIRADWLNEYTGLFICTLLHKERYRYSYGRAFVKDNIENTVIKLPITSNGDPDWLFVEYYIKSLRYKPITTKNVAKPTIGDLTEIHNWKEYSVGDIFDIKRGNRIVHGVDYFDSLDDTYCYPVITTTTLNNGIDGYYTEQNCDGNCIISAGEASGMFTTYQASPCWVLDTVRVYSFKDKSIRMNKYIGLFLSSILTFNMYRFSYGRKAKPDNMYTLDIKLPVNENGDPDWQYMEDYIKSLPYGDRI